MISDLDELNKIFDAERWLSENYGCEFYPSRGGWLNCSCPFDDHDDCSPSFGINPSTGGFKCFGCGRSGSFIQMISGLEKINFHQAINLISEYAGVDTNSIDAVQWKYEKFKRALAEVDDTLLRNKLVVQKATLKIKKIMKTDFDLADTMYKELDELVELEDYKQIKERFL